MSIKIEKKIVGFKVVTKEDQQVAVKEKHMSIFQSELIGSVFQIGFFNQYTLKSFGVKAESSAAL
jgi:hypothetical protein